MELVELLSRTRREACRSQAGRSWRSEDTHSPVLLDRSRSPEDTDLPLVPGWEPSMQLTASRKGRPWLLDDVDPPEPPTVAVREPCSLSHKRPLVDLPWPQRLYFRPCRWCGETIETLRPSKQKFGICADCKHGQCSRCGEPMSIVVNSLPPEFRLCHGCRGGARSRPVRSMAA